MFFGRNEENGLRCVYHGWKFDVDGVCVDLPNAPEGATFKDKIQIKRYPCVEAGDLIWAYMGPAEKKPRMPDFEWLKLPKSHRFVTKFVEQCNYLQAMEGDYDPSHARFLHSNISAGQTNTAAAFNSPAFTHLRQQRAERALPKGCWRSTRNRPRRTRNGLANAA